MHDRGDHVVNAIMASFRPARLRPARQPYSRLLAALALVLGCLATVALVTVLAACGPAATGTPAPVSAVAAPVTPAAMSDQQFARRFNAILAGYPDTQPVAVANVPAIIRLACQPGNLYQSLLPAAGWRQVQALLSTSRRCGR